MIFTALHLFSFPQFDHYSLLLHVKLLSIFDRDKHHSFAPLRFHLPGWRLGVGQL